MASQVYNEAKRAIAAGEMDLNLDDMRLLLLMTTTNADTLNDTVTNTDDISVLGETLGASYARQALASEAVNRDDANDRAEFDADDISIASLGNGANELAGALIHKHVTTDADSVPLCWVEFSGTINPGGSTFSITWNAEGIVQLA